MPAVYSGGDSGKYGQRHGEGKHKRRKPLQGVLRRRLLLSATRTQFNPGPLGHCEEHISELPSHQRQATLGIYPPTSMGHRLSTVPRGTSSLELLPAF